MTPDEHYLAADRLLAEADASSLTTLGRDDMIARAQVHAILATVNRDPRPAPQHTPANVDTTAEYHEDRTDPYQDHGIRPDA